MIAVRRAIAIALAGVIAIGAGTAVASAAKEPEVVVASGKMDGRFRTDSLFHIDEFWMQVNSGTEFHRWLSRGLHKKVVVSLTTSADELNDEKDTRILTGTLIHQTAPREGPGAGARLPHGDSGLAHILYLQDDLSGSLGAVTFETADRLTAQKFDVYDGKRVTVIIRIK